MSKERRSLNQIKRVLCALKQRLSAWRRRERFAPAWGHVKTMCISLLLAGNLALLAVFGAVKGYDWYRSSQTRIQMDAMLAEKGILCGSSVYRTLAEYPQPYTVRTDHAVHKAFAQALLTGEPTSYAEKGNATVWVGDNGSVSWAASGDVNASVTLGSIPEPQTEEQAQRIVQDVLDSAGITVRRDCFAVTQDETGYTVEVTQELQQAELIGCGMQFQIAPGNAVTVTGTWCTGAAQPLTVRALSSYSAQNMIFSLVAAQSEIVQIVSVQPTYVLSDRSGGRFTAIPCWRFQTDSGEYVLNILSGDVVSADDLDTAADADDSTDTSEADAADSTEDVTEDVTEDADPFADTVDDSVDTDPNTDDDSTDAADAPLGTDSDLWNAENPVG